MNTLLALIKNNYIRIIIILGLSISISCKTNNDINFIISKAFNEFGSNKEILIYRNQNNKYISNFNNIEFLNASELLERNNENFFLLTVKKNKEIDVISIYSFKNGKSLVCEFKNNKLINKNIEFVKIDESKPYYIYYEILKRKYPNYMNWKLFKIPQDSLK